MFQNQEFELKSKNDPNISSLMFVDACLSFCKRVGKQQGWSRDVLQILLFLG